MEFGKRQIEKSRIFKKLFLSYRSYCIGILTFSLFSFWLPDCHSSWPGRFEDRRIWIQFILWGYWKRNGWSYFFTLKSNWLTQGHGKDSEKPPANHHPPPPPWIRVMVSQGEGDRFTLTGANSQGFIATVELGKFWYTDQCLTKNIPDGQNHHTFSLCIDLLACED